MRIGSLGLWRVIAGAVLLVGTLVGCGAGLNQVRGKVTLDDGTPVTNGLVVFESMDGENAITARGEIKSDGSYQLSTLNPGDGVPAGKYRVLVSPIQDINAPTADRDLPFDKRFSSFSTSGLEFEVKRGSNDFPIQLTKPKGRR